MSDFHSFIWADYHYKNELSNDDDSDTSFLYDAKHKLYKADNAHLPAMGQTPDKTDKYSRILGMQDHDQWSMDHDVTMAVVCPEIINDSLSNHK
jgi:hypothetical protein